MSIFQGVKDKFNDMKQDAIERKAFMDLVRAEKKPIQRAAYMKQALTEAVSEGVAKAKLDAAKNKPKQSFTKADFGLAEGVQDPYKYLKKGDKKT